MKKLITSAILQDLYRYYYHNLSYFALVTNGKPKLHSYKLKGILLLFIAVMLGTLVSSFFLKEVFVISFFLVGFIGFSVSMLWFDRYEKRSLKKNNPQFIEKGDTINQMAIYEHRIAELKNYFIKNDLFEERSMDKAIKGLEKERGEAQRRIIFKLAIGAGILSLTWEDIRNMLLMPFHMVPEQYEPFVVLPLVLISAMVLYAIVSPMNEMKVGRWPLHEQLLGILKDMREQMGSN
ncbi:hypothetical protein [Olivibacter domesticus]|uniref:Uncharacterized protein n=1 Tax=Olivibacter domesticus TaxID=407022 RepID=A0A1H7WQ05_OLID1|nr:hypothetical protein [Olivibacter domesticus]SEM23444.1 hypothetical protein SAMN05661044_04602 [Olivibacter domesticus]